MLPNKKQPARDWRKFMKNEERKKIIVEVYQQHDNGKKVHVNTWEDEQTNILQLTAFLYRKTILKSRNLKIKCGYNYSDMQTITITESFKNYDESITKTSFVFENIPTNWGYLDIYKIEKNLNEREGK